MDRIDWVDVFYGVMIGVVVIVVVAGFLGVIF